MCRLERREGGIDRISVSVCLPGCRLQAARQLGLFPRPPPHYPISPSQPLSPISDGRMVWRRRRCTAS